MEQGLKTQPEYRSPFPNPWVYHGVPREDIRDLMQLYRQAYLSDIDRLPRALEQFTYAPGTRIAAAFPSTQSQHATQAAMFFLISDFIALYYARHHPTFEMRPIPQEVLNFLKPPYNQMTHLDVDSQRRFRESLPPEQRHLIYIDE